MNNIY